MSTVKYYILLSITFTLCSCTRLHDDNHMQNRSPVHAQHHHHDHEHGHGDGHLKNINQRAKNSNIPETESVQKRSKSLFCFNCNSEGTETCEEQDEICHCGPDHMGRYCSEPRNACLSGYNMDGHNGNEMCGVGVKGSCSPVEGSPIYYCECEPGYNDNPDTEYSECYDPGTGLGAKVVFIPFAIAVFIIFSVVGIHEFYTWRKKRRYRLKSVESQHLIGQKNQWRNESEYTPSDEISMELTHYTAKNSTSHATSRKNDSPTKSSPSKFTRKSSRSKGSAFLPSQSNLSAGFGIKKSPSNFVRRSQTELLNQSKQSLNSSDDED